MHEHTTLGVEEWKAMFRELGLSEADMQRWHRLFEARHPNDHQRFLEWLGLPEQRIDAARRRAQSGA